MGGGDIDWKAIHEKIARTGAAIEEGFSPSPEEKRKILKERAAALAREAAGEEAAEDVELVEFGLAGERWGVESSYVREVYALKDFTPLPCTPAFVFGLINVRGRIVSVVDIRKFFDMPEKGICESNSVLILRNDRMEFGILADSVLGVRRIASGLIQPSLPTLTGIRSEFLAGVTGDRLVVLDAGRLLSAKNIIVHEQA